LIVTLDMLDGLDSHVRRWVSTKALEIARSRQRFLGLNAKSGIPGLGVPDSAFRVRVRVRTPLSHNECESQRRKMELKSRNKRVSGNPLKNKRGSPTTVSKMRKLRFRLIVLFRDCNRHLLISNSCLEMHWR